MTGSRFRLLVPAAVGVLVVVTLALIALPRPSTYEARVSLLAVPVTQPVDQATQAQYGSIVGLGLPAISEIVRSPAVLGRAMPGAGPQELAALADAVSVELVPSSAVARIAVTDRRPEIASALASSIADDVVRADLLAPVARLRPLEPVPAVTDVSPGPVLVVGACLVTGLAAGVLTYLVRRLRRRRRDDDPWVRSLLTDVGLDPSVAILGSADHALADRLRILQEASGCPVRVVAVSATVSSRAAQLRDALARSGGRTQRRGDAEVTRIGVVLVVDRGRTHAADLASVIHVLPGDATLVAVVAYSPRAPTTPANGEITGAQDLLPAVEDGP